MARNSEMLKKRNTEIERHYAELARKFPHYKNDYILRKVADKYFLSPRTIYAIISGERDKPLKIKKATD